MTSSASTFPLDAYHQARLELWRSACISPESTEPLVQVGIEAVLAWLRVDAATPGALMELYGLPHGPLGPQLSLVASLLDPAQPTSDHHPQRLCLQRSRNFRPSVRRSGSRPSNLPWAGEHRSRCCGPTDGMASTPCSTPLQPPTPRETSVPLCLSRINLLVRLQVV